MWKTKLLKYCGNAINWGKENADKLLHILIMATFVILLKVVFPLWAVITIAAVLGFIKEELDNHLDWKDLVADALGILLGCL